MHADGAQLLRQLEPAVRPGSLAPTDRSGAASRGATGLPSFDALLAQMMHAPARGATGRPVVVDSTLAANVQLPQSLESPVAEAVDAAESAGARRAIVLTPGHAYTVDVEARRIIGTLPAEPGQLDLERVDVAVSARDPETEAALAPPTPPIHHARIAPMEYADQTA
jgi:hypothetical protein